jgi:hypothetical protein
VRTRPLPPLRWCSPCRRFVGVGRSAPIDTAAGTGSIEGSPAEDPAWVGVSGTTQRISVISPALGGRSQEVYVYLPPGYDSHPNKRYPVFITYHGSRAGPRHSSSRFAQGSSKTCSSRSDSPAR